MLKASPVEIRKCLSMVEIFKKSGIAFVPIPIISKEDYEKLYQELTSRIELLEIDLNL